MKRVLIFVSVALNVVILCGLSAHVIQRGGYHYLRMKYVATFVQNPFDDPQAPFYESSYYRGFVSLYDVLPLDSSSTIFIGDSHIERGRWTELLSLPVANLGIGGDDMQGLTHRMDHVLKHHPKKLFLLSGANDVIQGRSAEYILETYTDLVSRIRSTSPETQLYLVSLLPWAPNADGYYRLNSTVRTVNEGLMKLGRASGAIYVDAGSAVADRSGDLRLEFCFDSVHLNGQGYLAVAGALRPYVLDRVQETILD
jgi:lysophospholipase L1-like esterase